MTLYRHNRRGLEYELYLQGRKNSAEEVLHPKTVTPIFHSPAELARAWRRGTIVRIPNDPAKYHYTFGPRFAEQAPRVGASKALYHGLRPDAVAVLVYIGKRVHEMSGTRRPLILTSGVRDWRYQSVLMTRNPVAARSYSLHTTGYAFDILRSYASPRQAAAFQFVLDRLQAAGLIAYIREHAAIHIAVASNAKARLRAMQNDL
jgi:hypothetical protein